MPSVHLAITRAVSPEIAHCELTWVKREPISFELAVRQHERYCALLRRCGVEVVVLPADRRYPDCSFVEDTAVVVDEVAIITRMGAPARRGERGAVEQALARHRRIRTVQPPATLDGGDVLLVGRRVFVGLSQRTNEAGLEAVRLILAPHGYHVTPIRVFGCLHLKSACTAIDSETVLVNRQWVDSGSLEGVRSVFVPDHEPRAADVLRVNDVVCMHDRFPATRELVESLNIAVVTVDLSEFIIAEAGPTCLSILLSRRDRDETFHYGTRERISTR